MGELGNYFIAPSALTFKAVRFEPTNANALLYDLRINLIYVFYFRLTVKNPVLAANYS